MKTLFLNFSKDPNGLTENLAYNSFNIANIKTINIVRKKIKPLGQKYSVDDQFQKICNEISKIDNLIIGTPVYWSSMSSYMKIFIDRMTEVMSENPFKGKNLYLVVTGSDPSDTFPHIKHVWEHVSKKFDMNLIKSVSN
ncbi:flavodoxin family protein [Apilactobacillus timberlakei]|uniref:Flavodoxin family protein n=1 Tax=Apilactobacillus timberlakei TaxID=2008380 RepID=A0ABY2YRA7_9LACO|nr:NAD(P)H-dependent oxidoreductase [Apilactobacillus timberlakei]TPR12307.1 flavodoxin family protein [Apilactobacillus timberlakei]TPR12910.1 flavodoxin family protein [Apilactobacillus timberlakei]